MENLGQQETFPAVVVGGGLTGLLAVLKLNATISARQQKLAFIAPVERDRDDRTTAMLMPSIEVLQELGLWDEIKSETAPLKTMRLVDGSSRLIRSPVTDFYARELGLEAFGYNVPNTILQDLLESKITQAGSIVRYDTRLDWAESQSNRVNLKTSDGRTVDAQLVIAADGRHSTLRDTAQIRARHWSYPQTAIVLTFSHSLYHQGISTEFHTESGPFTQVPLPSTETAPGRSSLVWVVKPDVAESILERDVKELSQSIEKIMQSCLGKIEVEGTPQAFPLSGLTARSLGKNRIALVGEAGHVFPPIGAQGFNLGVRDVISLADCIAREVGDLGNDALLARYSRHRKADVALRAGGVDLLNRSLLTDMLPVHAARAFGLSALSKLSHVRQFVMRRGMGQPLMSPFSVMEKGLEAAGRWRSGTASR